MPDYPLESPSVEKSVIGSLLQGDALERRQFDYLWGVLTAGTSSKEEADRLFSNSDYRIIFDAIYKSYRGLDSNGVVTVDSVYDNLSQDDQRYIVLENPHDEMGLVSLLELAASAVPTNKKFQSQVDELRKKAALRQVRSDLHKIDSGLEDGEITSIDSVIEILDGVSQDSARSLSSELVSIGDKVEEIRASDRSFDSLSTGYDELDALINGYEDGRFYVIGARPKVGKTMFMVNNILTAMEDGAYILFVSLEMTAREILARLISAHSLQPFSVIWGDCMSKNLLPSQMEEEGMGNHIFAEAAKSEAAIESYDKFKILSIDGQHGIGGVEFSRVLSQITSLADLAQENGEKAVVFIDYLQLLAKNTEFKQQEVSGFSNTLKLTAGSLGIPIIANAQINRKGSEGPPRSYMLRDSGAIEADADAVLLLDRPHMRDENEPESVIKVDAEISRYSSTGVIDLEFQPEFQVISEFPPEMRGQYASPSSPDRSLDDDLGD